jgi:uncharacterized protein YggE
MKLKLFLLISFFFIPAMLFAQRQISVSGDGLATAKPDYALITFSIKSRSSANEGNFSKSNEATSHLVTLLGNAGVAATDIAQKDFRFYHDSYNSYSSTNYASTTLAPPPPPPPAPAPADEMKKVETKKITKKKGKNDKTAVEETSDPVPPPIPPPQAIAPDTHEMKHYDLTFFYEVKVRNFSSLAQVMDAIETAGGNESMIAGYDVADRQALKITAEENAFKNAREKGARLAKEMGGTLGDIVFIDDDPGMAGLGPIIKLVEEESFRGRNKLSNINEITERANIKVTFSVK